MNEEKKKKVLIIEDDEALRKVLVKHLNEFGVTVEEAGTGREGLNKITQAPPDLVILDIMLPGGMNGFDVLEQLKFSPKTSPIPVVVLTNLDSEQKTALEIGADDYIVKTNISLDEIVLKIRNKLQ